MYTDKEWERIQWEVTQAKLHGVRGSTVHSVLAAEEHDKRMDELTRKSKSKSRNMTMTELTILLVVFLILWPLLYFGAHWSGIGAFMVALVSAWIIASFYAQILGLILVGIVVTIVYFALAVFGHGHR